MLVGLFHDNTDYGVVTLSGETISDIVDDPANAEVRIIFRADGTIDKYEGGVTTQIDAGTDWIIPNGAANAGYDVGYSGLTGGVFTTESAAEDTTINLGADRTWVLQRGTVGTTELTCTFKIFIDAVERGSATFIFHAEVSSGA